MLRARGQGQTLLETSGIKVDPHQLLGLEVNPRAATITEIVHWIGYLQWHVRTRGNVRPPEPVIRNFRNIECRDTVLARDRAEYVAEIAGAPDLVVEIPSPGTEERDRNYKRTLYERYGVKEYWIVDPDAHTLERYVLTADRYGTPECYAESEGFESALFPWLSIALAEVFAV